MKTAIIAAASSITAPEATGHTGEFNDLDVARIECICKKFFHTFSLGNFT
jgi:hypothetical protein